MSLPKQGSLELNQLKKWVDQQVKDKKPRSVLAKSCSDCAHTHPIKRHCMLASVFCVSEAKHPYFVHPEELPQKWRDRLQRLANGEEDIVVPNMHA